MDWRPAGTRSRTTGSSTPSRTRQNAVRGKFKKWRSAMESLQTRRFAFRGVVAIGLVLSLEAFGQGEVKVGGIFDLTAITPDVGNPFAQRVRDALQPVTHGRPT